jgi:benzoylsuccinyl-CoA thiolase BbsB subunit
MSEVFVVGAGMTNFGPQPAIEVHELARLAVWEAIQSSGVDPRGVEAAFAGHAYQGQCFAQKALMKIGVSGIPMVNVENACASGSTALYSAHSLVASGQADIVVALGAEKLTRPGGGFLPIVTDDLESSMGRVMPSAFAMMAQMHRKNYGTTLEQMAMVAVKNRRNGALNPRCHFKDEITIADVLASPSIADPLTRLSCCPISDGAAAVILAGDRVARQLTAKPISIRSCVLVSGTRTPYGVVDDKSEMSTRAARLAYEKSGIPPEDVDVCELHDPFTIAELIHYEDLGFCRQGESGKFIEAGHANIDGKVAVSPSGGLMSKGHPLGATGIAQICEIFWQLRGEAGPRQVRGAKVGLAHTVGGGVTKLEAGACGLTILTV